MTPDEAAEIVLREFSSILDVAPGSVAVDLSCSCGCSFRGPAHGSVAQKFADKFRLVHSKPGHVVTSLLPSAPEADPTSTP